MGVIVVGLKEVLKKLKSIGRNLNQLVTLAHMGHLTVINLNGGRQPLCCCVVDSGTKAFEGQRWVACINDIYVQFFNNFRPAAAWG